MKLTAESVIISDGRNCLLRISPEKENTTMKKSRRFIASVLALALCLAVAVSALAEGKLKTLYQAGTKLLFDTDNVTLGAHAEFSYNDMLFKTMDAAYIQDGFNSLMDIKLKTPWPDGSVRDSGFTVVANGELAYSIEPVNNPYTYSVSGYQPSDSVLSDTLLRRTLTGLGGAVVTAAEGAFADKLEVSGQADGSRTYRVRLAAGDAPELLNQTGTLLAQLAAERYYYVNYDWLYPSEDILPANEEQGNVNINYEDYDATFAVYYQKIVGEKMPENFYEVLWGGENGVDQEAYEKYTQVSDALYAELVQPLQENYHSGAAMIHANGSVDYYETYDEYMVANHLQYVTYLNGAHTCFLNFYKEKTGAELTEDELNAIFASNNAELYSAYEAMWDEMNQKYQDILDADGKASLLEVRPDGSYRMIYDYNKYMESQYMSYGSTVTNQIVTGMEQLALGDTDVTFTLDNQDRLTAVAGSVTILVTDQQGQTGNLDIAFDFTASAYGDSHVGNFDPADYGVMSWDDFAKSGISLYPNTEDKPFPETITFDGVPYQVTVENAENE